MPTWPPPAQRPGATVVLTVTTTSESTVVAAAGELDNAVAGRLHECLNREILLRPRALIVDLTQADFCSAGIIRVLLGALSHTRTDGVPCAVVSTRRAVARPISALGLGHLVPLHPDLAAAEVWLTVAAAEVSPSPAG
ncbi:STAS domain-containing protein [Amycolatopsis sp. A133]|uniref:STAS domain-containing protein n=1 Tax=Amycolatopsis sp. A133 TaxID=3064472 RepID=UPI0027E71D05|nr:STAS domain-containing protein [Amycolatopsis sp. A133]MDQ7808568.1 STAS domain-containing protein [Amycolatopsis sp. A133]